MNTVVSSGVTILFIGGILWIFIKPLIQNQVLSWKAAFVIIGIALIVFAAVIVTPSTPIKAFEQPTPIPFTGGFQ